MAGFFSVAVEDPGRRALVEPDRGTTTYGELLSAANRYAHGLLRLGLAPGDTLAVMSGNRRELLELYAAGVQTGLFVVVLNWHLTADEVRYILENSAAKVLVAEDRFADAAFGAADAAGVDDSHRFVIGEATGGRVPLADLGLGRPESTPRPEDRHAGQAMFYTSGTTGKPKGVRKKLADVAPDDIALSSGIGLPAPAADPERVQLVPGPLYHAAPLAAAAGVL